MFWDQTLWNLFHRGGFAMWPLLFCSIMVVAIVVERFCFHLRQRMSEISFQKELKRLLALKKIREAISYSRNFPHPVAKITAHYLSHLISDEQRANVLRREGSKILKEAEQNLKALATVAHLSPLLGLLGTVTGLVSAFRQIEIRGGQVQPAHLANGIWEALITTVFGLLIAIPALAFFHYFENKVDFVSWRMQHVISELDEFFRKETQSKFDPSILPRVNPDPNPRVDAQNTQARGEARVAP